MTQFINWRRSRRHRKEHKLYILIINTARRTFAYEAADVSPSPISPGKVTRSLARNGHVGYASDACVFADTARLSHEWIKNVTDQTVDGKSLIFEKLLHLRPTSLSFVKKTSLSISLFFLWHITLYRSIVEYITEFSFLA